MSGINPLIDTLLHQVLGKRADAPPPRDLNQPIRPIAPSEAARAVHSDSRLDARPSSARSLAEMNKSLQGSLPPATDSRPAGHPLPSSTQTHFTPSARSIADLLIRFPAPPSVVRSPQPLFLTSDTLQPVQVAERLQGSVRDSGLFYESHLARWYRGEMPREQIQREPQMWRTQPLEPAPAGAARELLAPRQVNVPFVGAGQSRGAENRAGGLGAGAVTPASVGATALPATPLAVANQPATTNLAPQGGVSPSQATGQPLPAEAGVSQGRLARDPLHESLQGIVRHQLEMLVTPVLRWEGDVWSGIFMALVMHLPQHGRDGHEGREASQDDASHEEGEWRSEMTLEVVGLGSIGVDLWLRGARVDIDLMASGEMVRDALEHGLYRLAPRLEACGLVDVRLRVIDSEVPE